MTALISPNTRWHTRPPVVFLVLAAIIWLALYQTLDPVAEALVASLPVDGASHVGGALQFFFYDTPKGLMLLTGVANVMAASLGRLAIPAHELSKPSSSSSLVFAEKYLNTCAVG